MTRVTSSDMSEYVPQEHSTSANTATTATTAISPKHFRTLASSCHPAAFSPAGGLLVRPVLPGAGLASALASTASSYCMPTSSASRSDSRLTGGSAGADRRWPATTTGRSNRTPPEARRSEASDTLAPFPGEGWTTVPGPAATEDGARRPEWWELAERPRAGGAGGRSHGGEMAVRQRGGGRSCSLSRVAGPTHQDTRDTGLAKSNR